MCDQGRGRAQTPSNRSFQRPTGKFEENPGQPNGCRNANRGRCGPGAGAEEGFTGETGEYQCLVECTGDQNTHNGLGCLVEGEKKREPVERKRCPVCGQGTSIQHAVTQVRRGTTAGFAHIAVMHCTSLYHVKTSPQWATTRRNVKGYGVQESAVEIMAGSDIAVPKPSHPSVRARTHA